MLLPLLLLTNELPTLIHFHPILHIRVSLSLIVRGEGNENGKGSRVIIHIGKTIPGYYITLKMFDVVKKNVFTLRPP